MEMKGFICYSVFASLLVCSVLQDSVHSRPLLTVRPRPDDAAPLLVGWFLRILGVSLTQSLVNGEVHHLGMYHSGWVHFSNTNNFSTERRVESFADDLNTPRVLNVVSFSDGLPDNGKGIPYFYLTTLDPTASNALKDQRSSLTISEYNIGTCGKTDPENPTCAKITLVGKLKLVDVNSKEAEFAQTALFVKHAEMKTWPKGHNFQVFKLDIENIFMINWFGGPKPLTVDQYLKAKMINIKLAAVAS